MGIGLTFGIIFAIVAIVLLYIGWYTKRWVTDVSDFLIAGREVSLLINTFGIAAIAFAGTTIVFSSGLAVIYGFWGAIIWGLIVSFGGFATYGLIFAPFIRRCGAQTLPEWLEMRYDSRVRTIVTITTVIGLIGIMANNVVSMSAVVIGYVGWSLPLTISIVFLIFLTFSYLGGFWSITLTDFVQMILGLVILPIVILSLVYGYGNLGWVGEQVAVSGSNFWTSGLGGQSLPIFSLKYPSALTFAIVFTIFLVWGNNYYWLRVSSCRSERAAKMAYVYGAIMQNIPYVILAFVGLYSLAIFTGTFPPTGSVSPMGSYGVVLAALPVAVASLGLLAALVASISTATTAHIGAVSTVYRDIYLRIFRPDPTQNQAIVSARTILLITGLLTWGLAFYPGGPLYLFAFATSWLGPPAVLLMMGFWWRRMTSTGAFISVITGMSVVAVLTFLQLTKVFIIERYTHAGIVGFAVSLILAVVISLCTEPKYYGRVRPSFTGKEIDKISLSKEQYDVLNLIRKGYHTMAEIIDLTQADGRKINDIIEYLDIHGIIEREKLIGKGFYTFSLGENAKKFIAPIEEKEEKKEKVLLKDNLLQDELELMKAASDGNKQFELFVRQSGLNALKISAMISKLIRLGYVKEIGIFRRYILNTSLGEQMISKHSVSKQKFHIEESSDGRDLSV